METISDWNLMSDIPSKECSVTFKLSDGSEEFGCFSRVMRKDGMQMVGLGADRWMVGWREGENRCVGWKPRQDD